MADIRTEHVNRLCKEIMDLYTNIDLNFEDNVDRGILKFYAMNTKNGFTLYKTMLYEEFNAVKLDQDAHIKSIFTKMIQQLGGRLK